MFYILIVMVVTQVYIFVKAHQSVHVTVHFTIPKLYL